ncbi:MAG: 2-amino-4-hydroxy-6-hydroxymethyldihydropteridine diphosphokinase [Acidobacteriota bacterium]
MKPTKTAYIGLGTNLGDREANLARAIELLKSDRLRVTRVSSLWETEPRDMLDQPWFLNQVVKVETDLFPRQLFTRGKQIERMMGRIRTAPKGPRVIDVDILLYGNAIVNLPGLEIPHPGIPLRRFVLEPLAELAPGLHHPANNLTVRRMLTKVKDQDVRRVQKSTDILTPDSAS